jgi:hypothetical protein
MPQRDRLFVQYILLVAAICSLSAQTHTREMRYGLSIESRLQPDDEVVVVRRHVMVAYYNRVFTPREAAVELRRTAHGGAVILKVDSVTPRLVDGGSWIETTFSGVVENVLVPGRLNARAGERAELFFLWGGELKIGHVLVRAMLDNDDPLGVYEGRRYLMFVDAPSDPTKLGPLMPAMIFGIRTDGTLENPGNPESKGSLASPFDVLSGLTVGQVRSLMGR